MASVLCFALVSHMKLIDCDESYAPEILAIYNHAIITSTALYDYHPRTPEMMTVWFQNKRKGNYPIIGLMEETSGKLLGFASYGPFRQFPAYKYTVEHSIYVHHESRRQGLGKILLQEIIARAISQNYHLIVGVIDSQNATSIRLHEQFGFKHTGGLSQAGFKFNRWLDLVFYQLILPTPANPQDG